MYKLVFLLKRRPGLSVEAFQSAWLREAGPALAALPGLRAYVQSHPLPQGYRKGELLFDGLDELYLESEAAWHRLAASEPWREAAGRRAALLDPARTVAMPIELHVIKDGPIPPGAVKNVEFVNRRPGMPLAAFRAYWREHHGPLAATIPPLLRYEQNHLALSVYAGGGEPPYDGLAITWFRSTADMRAGTASPAYEATRADEAKFLPDGHLPIIICREQVLKAGPTAA